MERTIPKEKTSHLTLAQAITFNQAEWRRIKNGIPGVMQPIELHLDEVLDTDHRALIFKQFGQYINPAHKKNPPIIGVSLTPDLTTNLPHSQFYLPGIYDYHPYRKETAETIVCWLTHFALGKNPTKEKGNKTTQQTYDQLVERVKKREFDVDYVTEAFARSQFMADNQMVDIIFPDVYPVGLPDEIEASQKQLLGTPVDAAYQAVQMKDRRQALVKHMPAIGLSLRISGFSIGPGLINITPSTNLIWIAEAVSMQVMNYHYLTHNVPPLAVLACLLTSGIPLYKAIKRIGDIKDTVVHEHIHNYGIGLTIDEGFQSVLQLNNRFFDNSWT